MNNAPEMIYGFLEYALYVLGLGFMFCVVVVCICLGVHDPSALDKEKDS